MHRNLPEYLPEYSGIFRNIPEYTGIFRNQTPEYFTRPFRNITPPPPAGMHRQKKRVPMNGNSIFAKIFVIACFNAMLVYVVPYNASSMGCAAHLGAFCGDGPGASKYFLQCTEGFHLVLRFRPGNIQKCENSRQQGKIGKPCQVDDVAQRTHSAKVGFPLPNERGLFWSTSLFDRRTWPLLDVHFDTELVQRKLHGIKEHLPAASV